MSQAASDALRSGAAEPRPLAAMSIDVEDWFHVENLKPAIPRHSWKDRELRVERNTERMLEWMAQSGARSTCFVLGWVAERCRALVERIAAAGHEIACHGYGHELLPALSPEELRADVLRCKTLLEDITGAAVRGYRAPSFSITDWAVPILEEVGLRYDSSLFPTFAHDRYGRLSEMPAGRVIAELRPGFHEVCLSVLRARSRALPWAGGGYFRLLPYPVFRGGIARILRAGEPYVFYIHPWEVDPDQPRVEDLPALARFRHYVRMESTGERFQALLGDFRWTSISEVLATSIESPRDAGRA